LLLHLSKAAEGCLVVDVQFGGNGGVVDLE
jgi:hypothetical protein